MTDGTKLGSQNGASSICGTLPPPIPGAWRDLTAPQTQLLLARLKESFGATPHGMITGDIRIESARILPTSFYEGWMLCDLLLKPPTVVEQSLKGQIGTELAALSYLYGPDGFMPLAGRSDPIHQHNSLHGVDLSDETRRLDYLRFFCFAVHGEGGPFMIHETVDTLDLGAAVRGSEETAAIAAAVRPLEREPDFSQSPDELTYRACVHFAQDLFTTRFSLGPTGMVAMLDDAPVAERVAAKPAVRYAGHLRYTVVQGAA